MQGFHHEACFYADAQEFLERTLPFVREGLEREEGVLVALPRRNLTLLRDALGGDGERVAFAAMEELGRNPGRIISAWSDFLDAQLAVGRGARGIGEPIWAGREAGELDECHRHEALLNVAFGDAAPWSLVCPYNTAELDDEVLDAAARNHPVVCRDGVCTASGTYADPLREGSPFDGELPPPPAPAARLAFGAEQIDEVRRFVAGQAALAGLDGRRDDLVLAVNEAAGNSIRHGAGHGTVRIWHEAGAVVCEVCDAAGIAPGQPLIGRRRPAAERTGGRGLWIANQLCDLVQIRSGPGGSAVRLRVGAAAA